MNILAARALAIAVAMTTLSCATGASKPSSGAPMPSTENPFFAESTLPLHYPPFDQIKDSHFAPAFDRGMTEQLAEVEAVAGNPQPATFENTIVAMERSGRILDRATTVFFNLVAADNSEARQKLEADYSPKLSAHNDAIFLNAALYARIKALYDNRATLGLDAESTRLIERYHTAFVRSGARLSDADKARLKEVNAELATLGTQFSQNVLAEVNASAIVIDDVKQLAGLPPEQIGAAAEAAKTRHLEGKWVIALQNTTGQPPNTHLSDRAVRQRIHNASVARGSRGNEFDNTSIIARVARLRAERAHMLGYANHAAYVLEDETALTPQAVNQRLAQLVPPAVANARREAADIQAIIKKEGGKFEAQVWDWDYYAEKVRKQRFDFDESQLKPYLEFNHVLQDGVFFAASRLYGITFKERKDLPVYHPDVRVFDVFEEGGKQLAILIYDPFARESKRGGAWMNAYVPQSRLLGNMPVVANHLNINKPAQGQPALLTWDEVTTMFHEFGHALHGMFSNVKYPYFAGTSVPRDFVEYPSQVNEMWADWPEVLSNYARHHETGQPMPPELVKKVLDAQKFNQGYATTEYLAASLIDQHLHQLAPDAVPDAAGVMALEAAALKSSGIDFPLVPPRYRLPYFSHIMGGYAAAYYAYIWSEVLDADTVEWFKENGGLSRTNGNTFRTKLLSQGGSADAMKLFVGFRGREPDIAPLLKRRGLVPEGAATK